MKLRRVLAIFWMILLMLTATSYAENTENPIIADTQNGYIRMDVPYVKKVTYYGRSYVRCAYTTHEEQYLPYGIPVVNEVGKDYVLFDTADDMVTYYSVPIDIDNWTMYKFKFVNISGNALTVYDTVKSMFPALCNEVAADNRAFDAAHKNDFNQAEKAVSEKDWETAYKHLKNIYDGGCHDQAIARDLGKACWELGNYDEALEWETRRIDAAPIASAYNQRAWHNYLLGNYEQALDDAQWAVMKDKEDANILDTRGTIYYALGQYDKAMADFNKSLEINDESAHTYYYRSLCNQALGRNSEANSDYGKAEKYDPNIIDDIGKFQHTRLNHANAKQQRHKAKLNKYKDDLKKLNDAIYVTNNSSQFPAQTVWENDGVIISVVGGIKQNETDDFYKEVVPQEVRTKYESGVYQQQYEQLGSEINVAAAVPGTGNGPQLASDGAIATAPTTLPTNSSEEIYDLNNTVLKYYSEGQRYILSYEDPMKTYNYLKAHYGPTTVDFVDRPHGKYLFKQDYGYIWGDFSFDYDYDTHEYLIYDGAGLKQAVRFDDANNAVVVRDFVNSQESGVYEYSQSLAAYVLYPQNYTIKPHILTLVRNTVFNGDSDIGAQYEVEDGHGVIYEVALYPEKEAEARPNLPAMWYKMTNENDPSEWTAFTYDKATNVFAMYGNDGATILNYAKRWFTDANHIENHLTDTPLNGAMDGVYERTSSGEYYSGYSTIFNYITDGLFNFMHYVKKF